MGKTLTVGCPKIFVGYKNYQIPGQCGPLACILGIFSTTPNPNPNLSYENKALISSSSSACTLLNNEHLQETRLTILMMVEGIKRGDRHIPQNYSLLVTRRTILILNLEHDDTLSRGVGRNSGRRR